LTKLGLCCFYNCQLKASKKKPSHCEYLPDKTSQEFIFGKFQVIPLPISTDNLSYIIKNLETNEFSLIDPADITFIQSILPLFDLQTPSAILTTHKHWDHAGHNHLWLKSHPSLKIIGGENENVPAANQ
jgi:glyoxylase-like metal-dependent hydrolase (beta-lactamase superfamily II)